ncbi:YidC/Oxa1 family membrane protein insertase [Patescibacteria group bacterium]|nr:YidC/Oxa1 family membrane protein insertase [Patescibacteria group bacterium]
MIDIFFGIFRIVLYQPLLNALVFLYAVVPGNDFGVAVILLTVLLRLAMYPLSGKAIRAQQKMAELQPRIKELQERFKNDKEKQAKEMLQLYKAEKINPFSSMAPLLLQLPVLLALFQVFRIGFGPEQLALLYVVPASLGASIDTTFLGLLDLQEKSFLLAGLVGVSQFLQAKTMAVPKSTKGKGGPDFSQALQKQMLYVFPFFLAFIALQFSAVLSVYLLTSNMFTVGQQLYMKKKKQGNA